MTHRSGQRPYFHEQMSRYEQAELAALAVEVLHPVGEYTEERVARLLAQVEEKRRHPLPPSIIFNV